MENSLLRLALNGAYRAGNEIMKFYREGFAVDYKTDDSPVTEADQAANIILEKVLGESGYPIMSEEGLIPPFEVRRNWDLWWCIDPLDGTKGFVKRNGEFAINIALMKNTYPVFGLIYLPTTNQVVFNWENEVYNGQIDQKFENSKNLMLNFKRASKRNSTTPYIVLSSRNNEPELYKEHLNLLNNQFAKIESVKVSSAIKFYKLALGEANEYPRFQGSMEWDIAAGQAIVEALGFEVTDVDTKERLSYNKPTLLNPHFIIRISNLTPD